MLKLFLICQLPKLALLLLLLIDGLDLLQLLAHIFFSVIDWGHRRLQKEPQFFFHVRKKNMNYTRSVAKNGPFFMSGACAAHSLSMLWTNLSLGTYTQSFRASTVLCESNHTNSILRSTFSTSFRNVFLERKNIYQKQKKRRYICYFQYHFLSGFDDLHCK